MQLSLRATALALTMLYASTSASATTTVRIHYDAGNSRINLRGDKAPLSWTSNVATRQHDGKVWTYSWPDEVGQVVKFGLGQKVGAYQRTGLGKACLATQILSRMTLHPSVSNLATLFLL